MANTFASISLFMLLLVSSFPIGALSDECSSETGECINKATAFPLKILAIVVIFLTSLIGVGAPLVTRSIPALNPERSLFVILKAFASGIILATGFMHVLPDSFHDLSSPCLPDSPWHKFPFTGFVAMISAIFTLMVDSFATSLYAKKNTIEVLQDKQVVERADQEAGTGGGHRHAHGHGIATKEGVEGSQLLRYKVVAMVLEMGIIVHSIVIGLGMGASNNVCTIRPLVAALCFHQMFEGMGLGGCILQAEYKLVKRIVMVFFFAVTTPFGIAVGMVVSNSYKENSPHALMTVGLLNASSAGLLIYMALVDLLSADFMGPKLQANIKLQVKAYIAVILGASGMSIMALWA